MYCCKIFNLQIKFSLANVIHYFCSLLSHYHLIYFLPNPPIVDLGHVVILYKECFPKFIHHSTFVVDTL